MPDPVRTIGEGKYIRVEARKGGRSPKWQATIKMLQGDDLRIVRSRSESGATTIGEGKYIKVEARIGTTTPTKQEVIKLGSGDSIDINRVKPPAPTPPPPPPPVPEVGQPVGYAAPMLLALQEKLKDTTPIVVRDWGALGDAVETNRPRRINLVGDNWDGHRERMDIKNPDIWIDGNGMDPDAWIRRGWFQNRASRVVADGLKVRTGDDVAAPDDSEPWNMNGSSGQIDGVYLRRMSLLWGSDIGMGAILYAVRNVTFERCIGGGGLFASRHKEGAPARASGHSKGFNITQLVNDQRFADLITFFRNLFTTSDDRMIQLYGCRATDIIGNIFYNQGRPASWNPRSANVVGNFYLKGPQTPTGSRVARSNTNDSNPSLHQASVYFAQNKLEGMTEPSFGSGVRASSPRGTLSAPVETLDLVKWLGEVGPTNRDEVDALLVKHALNRTSDGWYNGINGPAPKAY